MIKSQLSGSPLPSTQVCILLNGKDISVPAEFSVRRAALHSGVYIPGLCSHPELDQFKPFVWSEAIWQGENQFNSEADTEFPHCGLCQVEVNDELERACTTRVREGLRVTTESSLITKARREALKKILAQHPHTCLSCAQAEGCSRTQCSMNVPEAERCCELLGHCEIGKVAEYIGIPPDTPRYQPRGRRVITDEPLFIRDYELCINCLRCVRVCREARGVDALGAAWFQGEAYVGTRKGPRLIDAVCRFCGACVELCPTGALRDKKDTAPLIDGQAPCVAACPLGIDIPGYLELIAKDLDAQALELIYEKAVLPGVLGYACFHPCEDKCRRTSLDQPLAICALKRFVAETVQDLLFTPASPPCSAGGIEGGGKNPSDSISSSPSPLIPKAPPSSRRAAVIGGGPAGLAAAAELLRQGHKVVLFESSAQLGGMLNQALPDFRLPPEIVERDLKYILNLGLETRLNQTWGKDFSIDDMFREGFQAVIVAVGLSEAVTLDAPGYNLEGVHLGLDFLRNVKSSKIKQLSGPVVVIGGGSVAIDAAMTSRRMGGNPVTVVCLESPAEMPAHPMEVKAAQEEGINIQHRWGVLRIEGRHRRGRVVEITLQRCLRVFDQQRRFAPEFNPTITISLPAQQVILAVGQRLSGELKANLTSQPGVFLAGDAQTGPSSIVSAMADGRRAAAQIQAFWETESAKPVISRIVFPPDRGFIGRDESFHLQQRAVPEILSPEKRVTSFKPYEQTLALTQARAEAARCLRCHLRAYLVKAPLPPDFWKPIKDLQLEEIPAQAGVLILADQAKKTIRISGAANLNSVFQELLTSPANAVFCRWELDPMFTKRESELIGAHLAAYGEMPGGGELDDLF